jgi:hypothetical protein
MPCSSSGPREPVVAAETLDYAFLHLLGAAPLDLDEEHRSQRTRHAMHGNGTIRMDVLMGSGAAS